MATFNRAMAIFFILLAGAHSVLAQQQDSFIDSPEALYEFVDENTKSRNFPELISVLGGRDEYTVEELTALDKQFRAIYPRNFDNRALVKSRKLMSGFSENIITNGPAQVTCGFTF